MFSVNIVQISNNLILGHHSSIPGPLSTIVIIKNKMKISDCKPYL